MSALLADFPAKGLLDQTPVVPGTEFGRKALIDGDDARDHDNESHRCLLAGVGMKPERQI
jgi:uncharacterized protein (DUF1501 family)